MTNEVKLTPNQPGGFDLDTFRPVLYDGGTTGDLRLLHYGFDLVDLEPLNEAALLIPGSGKADHNGCTSPEEVRERIKIAGDGSDEGFQPGAQYCVDTNGGNLASLTVKHVERSDDENDWFVLLDVTRWPAS